MLHTSKSSINPLAQKLPINHWWNWPQLRFQISVLLLLILHFGEFPFYKCLVREVRSWQVLKVFFHWSHKISLKVEGSEKKENLFPCLWRHQTVSTNLMVNPFVFSSNYFWRQKQNFNSPLIFASYLKCWINKEWIKKDYHIVNKKIKTVNPMMVSKMWQFSVKLTWNRNWKDFV